jgi:hypothetical protein
MPSTVASAILEFHENSTKRLTGCNINIAHWVLQVMFPSACSFIVLVFTVFLICLSVLRLKDSENQHNKAARRRKHNLQNPLNNTVQQDAKI